MLEAAADFMAEVMEVVMAVAAGIQEVMVAVDTAQPSRATRLLTRTRKPPDRTAALSSTGTGLVTVRRSRSGRPGAG